MERVCRERSLTLAGRRHTVASVSEYQRYEFLALDRNLSEEEMTALRRVSTRAKITPRGFWNEYHWGDLKADPRVLLERYFDAHAYVANWGARRLMLRVPANGIDLASLRDYFVRRAACTRRGKHVIIDLESETDDSDQLEDYDDDGRAFLDSVAPIRAELIGGDLRPAYLAWLLSVQSGEIVDTAREPVVPAGLRELTPAQSALVEFLRIDSELLTAAALASEDTQTDDAALRAWVLGLSLREKDAWLARAIDEAGKALGDRLRAEFRETMPPSQRERRRVDEILAAAARIRETRERAIEEAARNRELGAARRRAKALDALARRGDVAWAELETKIEARDYDAAVALAVDLRDAAARGSSSDDGARIFAERFDEVRRRHQRRKGFFDRWRRVQRSAS